MYSKVFDPSFPSMRKVDDGEKNEKKRNKEEKKIKFFVATIVVASRPPEHRPTGTPHACANIQLLFHKEYPMGSHVDSETVSLSSHEPRIN